MTNREFYSVIANSNLSDEIKEHANKALSALDERNAKRKTTKSKEQIANEGIMNEIEQTLVANPNGLLARDIVALIGYNTQKITVLCGKLAKENRAISKPFKEKGKNTALKWYAVSTATADEGEE